MEDEAWGWLDGSSLDGQGYWIGRAEGGVCWLQIIAG